MSAPPPFRDRRGFRDMWESATDGERWLALGSVAFLVVAVCFLGRLG